MVENGHLLLLVAGVAPRAVRAPRPRRELLQRAFPMLANEAFRWRHDPQSQCLINLVCPDLRAPLTVVLSPVLLAARFIDALRAVGKLDDVGAVDAPTLVVCRFNLRSRRPSASRRYARVGLGQRRFCCALTLALLPGLLCGPHAFAPVGDIRLRCSPLCPQGGVVVEGT